MTFVFLFLTYFILYNRFEVHPPHQMCAFDGWVIFHCIYVLQLLYPFIFWWTSMLLPCPRYYKQCCSKHWGIWVFFLIMVSSDPDFSSYGYIPRSRILGSYGSSTCNFSHTMFHSSIPFYILANSVSPHLHQCL